MYTGQQHYCHNIIGGFRDCTSDDGAFLGAYEGLLTAAPVIPCAGIGLAGVTLPANLKCLDAGGLSTATAAHEFGHLLGLPDEYPPDRNLADPFTPCYRTLSNPREGCALGEEVGIMADAAFPVQQRYFDYLFSSLDNLTPGFQWTFGYSPTWNDGQPLPYSLPILDGLELPPSGTNGVPEPGTAALAIFALLAIVRSRIVASWRRGLPSSTPTAPSP